MAFLKLSDLQYEDKKYKKYWSEQYGYDYSANALVQSEMEKMVRIEVDLGTEQMSGREKSLVPRVANYTINYSQNITVTSADVDAFSARFPHVGKVGTAREEAIQLLKNGGTHAPESESEAEEPVEEPVQPPPSPEEATEDEQPDRVETPVIPQAPTVATHVVSTNSGSRLALREAAANSSVSESATQDTDKKGALIEMIDNGSGLILLDPGVGHKCEWDYVRFGNKEGYVYNKFIKQSPSFAAVVLEYDCETSYSPSFIAPVDWTAKEPNSPYVNEETGKWYVAVETEHESTGGAELTSRMGDAIPTGVELILSENGKDTSEETVTRVVAAICAAKAEDYYVSPNSGENMRVLVSFPKKYISKLKEKNPEVESEMVMQNGTVASGTFYSEAFDSRRKVTRQIVLSLNPIKPYKERLKAVTQGFRGYAVQIDSFEGEVKNLDFRKEADRFETIIPKIDALLTANGAATSGMHSVELGLDQDYIPVYASENSNGYYKQMTSGWDSFVDSEPLDSPRTMNYLFYLWDMEEAVKQEMNWTEFVGRFTDFERVEIKPSKSGEDSPTDISGMGNEDNPSSSGNTSADKADKKISKSDEPDSSCFKETSLVNLAKGNLKKNSNTMKNSVAKLADDAFLGSTQLRKSVRDEALAAVDFVGDPLVADLRERMKKIEDLDDVFNVVLNKISLMDLVGAILECFSLELKLDIDLPLPLRFDCLELPTVPSIKFPDNLPTVDIMSDLAKEIFEAIVQALTQAFVAMLKDLVESLFELCKEEEDSQNVDINDGITEAAEAASMDQDEADRKAKADKLAVLDAAGLLSNDIGGALTPEEKAGRLGDMGNLLTDVSMLIPPSELCRLLKGRSSARTLSLIRSLVKRKYPSFYKKLKTKTQIKDFLVLVGRMVNSDFCDALARSPKTRHGTDFLCADTDLESLPAAQALLAKGGGITEDQVLEQLERAQERKKDRAKQIEDLLKKAMDLQSGKANPFQDAMPPLFCGTEVDENGNTVPVEGLIKLKHDSLDFMVDKVLDTVYAPIYMAFNRDINSYAPTVVKGTNEKREVPASFKTEKDEWIWHPEVKKLEAQGITFDFDTGSKKAKDAKNKKIEVTDGVRQVSPTARNLLRSMEYNGSFSTNLDNEGVYYELILPPDPDMKEALSNLTDTLTEALSPSQMAEYGDLSLENLTKVMPDWKIRYKMPWQFYDTDHGQRVDDEYMIEIFSGDEPSGKDSLRRISSGVIPSNAKKYIQTLYPQNNSVFKENKNFSWRDLELTSRVNPQSKKVEIFSTTKKDPCEPIAKNFVGSFAFDPTLYNENISPDDAYKRALGLTGQERCRYIEMYMGKVEVWEKLKSLYEDGECWDYSTVKDFHSYMLPPQQSVFGAHVRKVWADKFDEVGFVEKSSKLKYLDEVESFYSNFVQPQVAADVLSLMAKQIAESKMFDSKPESFKDQTFNTPYIDKIMFLREPSKIEKACGIDPHPLATQDFKRAVKEDFENSGGMCSLIEGLEDTEKQTENPIKVSIMKSLVEMTVRTYVIDYFLRGIFSFTEFSIEDTLDDLMVEFMVKKMVSEMESYNDGYAEAFLQWLPKIGTPIKDPEQDVPATGESTDVNESPQEPDLEQVSMGILKDMILEQFVIVAVEMRDIFDNSNGLSDVVFWGNRQDVHTKFVNEWLPLIDLQKEAGEVRFANVRGTLSDLGLLTKDDKGEYQNSNIYNEYGGSSVFTSDGDRGLLEDYYNAAISSGNFKIEDGEQVVTRRVDERVSFDTGKEFDLSNGNLVLEKFYRVVPKPIDANYMATKIVDDLFQVEYSILEIGYGNDPSAAMCDEYHAKKGTDGYNPSTELKVFCETKSISTSEAIDNVAPSEELKSTLRTEWISKVAGIVDDAFAAAFGADFTSLGEKYFSVAEIDSTMDAFVLEVFSRVEGSGYINESYQTSYASSGVYDGIATGTLGGGATTVEESASRENKIKNSLLGDDLEQALWKIENFFDNIQPGLRMVYVPPVDNANFQENASKSKTDLNKYFGTTSAVISEPDNKVDTAMTAMYRKYGAFKVEETYADEFIQTGTTTNSEGETETSYVANINGTMSRFLYTTPLVEVFNDDLWSDIKGDSILSLSGKTLNNNFSVWASTWNNYNAALRYALRTSVQYETIFKYCIPVERFLGLLSTYTMMTVSAAPNVEAIFSGTKDELNRAFWVLANNSYKAPPSVSNEDMARLLDFYGGISTPCFSFSFGGMPGGMKGFGIDLILKLAIKTPLAIFKFLVEMIDPNIKIAKWILDLAKFIGVCLPMPLISLGLLPPTVFGFPPLGIGIGPPLTPLGFGYLALGFEIPMGNPFGDDDDDGGSSVPSDVCETEAAKRKKEKQEKVDKLMEKIVAARKGQKPTQRMLKKADTSSLSKQNSSFSKKDFTYRK